MANNTAARTAIKTQLLACADRVYFDHANPKAEFPYVVYNVEELDVNSGLTLCELEVNVMDYGEETAVCEALADTIQSALHFYHYLDAEIGFSLYRERRQPIQEEDKKIIRRRLTFEMRLYERG